MLKFNSHKNIRIWDIEKKECVGILEGKDWIMSLTIWNKFLISSSYYNEIKIWK